MPSKNDKVPKQGRKKGERKTHVRSAKKDGAPTSGASKPSPKRKRVTLSDIAHRAGVSTATVSLTLAERLDVPLAAATRERIKQCALELGYVPNRLTDGFFRGRSNLIGILIMADSYRPFLSCIAGIHESLAQADCFPLLMSGNWMEGHRASSFSDDQEHSELADLFRLLAYQVDGILYFSLSAHRTHAAACAKELASRKIPMVILGGVDTSGGTMDIVGGDNHRTGRMVADHLLSVGCTSFIFIKPARFHPLDDDIYDSFAAKLTAEGHSCSEFTQDAENPGDLRALLSRQVRPPSGIFCTRDDIAALVLQTVLTLGWRVPHDVAVVTMGQAQMPVSRFSIPPTTIVERHSFKAGKEAVKLLLQRIEGFSGKPKCILIPPSLEVRASSMSEVLWQVYSSPLPQASPRPRSKKRG